MDIGSVITSALVGNCAYDFVKNGLLISGIQLKEIALERLKEWHFDDIASEKIANRLNEKGYLANESEQEYCDRLSKDIVLKAMLEQFSKVSTSITQSANNSPNSILVGRDVKSLTINHAPSIQNKTPKIDVSFLPNTTLQIETKLDLYDHVGYRRPIEKSKVPDYLLSYITDEKIAKYNKALPTQKNIDEYNEQAKLYFSAQRHTVTPNIRVENLGEHSAIDVIVSIDFPELVRVFHKNDVKHIEEANITFPDCPLSEAKVQYEMEQKSKFGLLMASLEPVKLMAKSYTLPETVLFPKSMLPTKSFSGMLSGIDFDNNKIIIRRKKILHTQFELFDDIALVPVNQGHSSIKIEVICEEYRKPVHFEIPISVL